MKAKKNRLQLIVDLIKKTNVGNQNELAEMLRDYGVNVTQATLSRDLKALHITKVANASGGYMYIVPNGNELQDSLLMKGQSRITASQQVGFVSIEFSDHIAVIKTRNGYATGLAYDIDMSHSPYVLGTIAGADTVFAIMRENVSRKEALRFFARFVPIDEMGDD